MPLTVPQITVENHFSNGFWICVFFVIKFWWGPHFGIILKNSLGFVNISGISQYSNVIIKHQWHAIMKVLVGKTIAHVELLGVVRRLYEPYLITVCAITTNSRPLITFTHLRTWRSLNQSYSIAGLFLQMIFNHWEFCSLFQKITPVHNTFTRNLRDATNISENLFLTTHLQQPGVFCIYGIQMLKVSYQSFSIAQSFLVDFRHLQKTCTKIPFMQLISMNLVFFVVVLD